MKKNSLTLRQLAVTLLVAGTVATPLSVLANETVSSATTTLSTEVTQNTTETAASTVQSSAVSTASEMTSVSDLSNTASSAEIERASAESPTVAADVDSSEEKAVAGSVTIYRLYNKDNGEHLYTPDANEKDVLYRKYGWGYEGEAWYAPAAGKGTPVYRLYNAAQQNHLYTTDVNEVNILTARHGWTKDFNGQPIFYSAGSSSIYRVYNKGLRGLHHWTTDTNEYNALPKYGWQQEGVKFYALAIGSPIRTQYYEGLPSGSYTIENAPSYTAIEADVTVSGGGTGYHAKLTINSPTSAISFGLQYDVAARPPHTGKTSFMVENIRSNNPGGQSYYWTGLYSKNPGTTYRLLLTLQKDGTYVGYINGAEVTRGQNTELASHSIIATRVEGAARKRGDSIDATFSNIRIKHGTSYDASRIWIGSPEYNVANGLVTYMDGQSVGNTQADSRPVKSSVRIKGTLNNLPDNADWDTAGWFEKVSGVVLFR